jgi:hypothetical protein
MTVGGSVVISILTLLMVTEGYCQVHLTLVSGSVCFGTVVSIVCYYPNIAKQSPPGHYIYYSTQPSWRKNGSWFLPNSVLIARYINSTATALNTRIGRDYYLTVVYFSCYLLLNDAKRTRDISNNVLLDAVEPSVPMLAKVILNAELSRVQWNHRTSGDCYTECSFHFDVRVYSTDQPDYSRSLSVSTLYVNLTNLSVNTSYRMEIKAICSQHDAQSEPLLLDFAIKDSSSTKEDKFNVDYLETASCCNSFPTRLATVTAPKSNNVSTEDTTIPLELFSIAAGLLVVFVLLIVCIVVVASFVLKRRWTRNRSDIKEKNIEKSEHSLCVHSESNYNDSDQGQASETEDIYGRIEMERNPCYVEL